MSYKLYDRRGKSCMNLNCFQEAVQDFSKAQELARQHLGSDDPKLQAFVKEMDRALQSCSSKANKSQPLDLEQKSLPMLTGKNLSMPALSQAVKIQYSPEVAQFLTKYKQFSKRFLQIVSQWQQQIVVPASKGHDFETPWHLEFSC